MIFEATAKLVKATVAYSIAISAGDHRRVGDPRLARLRVAAEEEAPGNGPVSQGS
jgi:hypothetical protein